MDFNEFRNRLEQDVGKIISEAYPGSTAVPREVDKLQGQSYSALSVSAKDSRLGMSLNMDSLYVQMQGGTSYADIVQQAGQQIRPAMVRGMSSVLGMLGGEEATDGQLVVVTTEDLIKGASAIFYPGMMDSASRMLKQDFFILPSSVHEVLLLPDDGVIRTGELQSMVAEINAMAVNPVDQLTDNVYHYDADERIFETGLGFEERRTAREAAQEKSGSVLDGLRSRQKENEMKPRAPHKAAAKEASL